MGRFRRRPSSSPREAADRLPRAELQPGDARESAKPTAARIQGPMHIARTGEHDPQEVA
jgi:hypothetical protein